MQKFCLQAALSGAKLVTRDGREVTEFKIDQDGFGNAIIPGFGREIYNKHSGTCSESDHDLFIAAPKTRTMWVNYYRSMGKPPFECERIWLSSAFDDKIEAEEFANSEDHPFYIATLPIEIPQP